MVAFLSKLYSPMGRTAYDPTAMLGASLLLITQVPCKSLHGIPDFLAGNPLYAALGGFANRSTRSGYLGDPQNLRVVGDGTTIYVHANGSGTKACDCPRGTSCNHPRRFSSPDANWGWDDARDRHFYGGFLIRVHLQGS